MSYFKLAIAEDLPFLDIKIAAIMDRMKLYGIKSTRVRVGDINIKVKKTFNGFKVSGHMVHEDRFISDFTGVTHRILSGKIKNVSRESLNILSPANLFNLRNIVKHEDVFYVDSVKFETLKDVIDELYKPIIDDELRVMNFIRLVALYRYENKESFDEDAFKDISVNDVIPGTVAIGSHAVVMMHTLSILNDENLMLRIREWMTEENSYRICREIFICVLMVEMKVESKERLMEFVIKRDKIQNKIENIENYFRLE